MKTHGDRGWEDYPSYLNVLIPKVLDLLDHLDFRITFFVVGRDAALEKNRDVLGMLTSRGHEVGNHSFDHEQWLHTFDSERLQSEIQRAGEEIERVTNQRPLGFRGPGFNWSPAIMEVLATRGYLYDASTLPTYIGPLGRLYYFWKASLSKEEKEGRSKLFGSWADGLRPIKPYYWQFLSGARFLEIPVTTIPILKIPFHLSYLHYLSRFSKPLMSAYLGMAMKVCRLTQTSPSFLLHPLDFLGGDKVQELKFFPGMDLPTEEKVRTAVEVLTSLKKRFTLVNMSQHAGAVRNQTNLKTIRIENNGR